MSENIASGEVESLRRSLAEVKRQNKRHTVFNQFWQARCECFEAALLEIADSKCALSEVADAENRRRAKRALNAAGVSHDL